MFVCKSTVQVEYKYKCARYGPVGISARAHGMILNSDNYVQLYCT